MTYNKKYEIRAVKISASLDYNQKNFRVWNTATKTWWSNPKNKKMPFYEAQIIADALNNGSIKE